MTTLESYKKFGLEMPGAVGGILTLVGCAVTILGLAAVIVDQATGNFGLDGVTLVLFLLLFAGMGLALIFAGVRKILKDKKRVDGLREAYENHRCVMADIMDVRANTSTEKTSDNMFTGTRYREFYTVECHYKDAAGVTHIYYSRSLYFDPAGLIIAKQVPVYIDRNNEENVYVDIDQALAPMKVHG